MFMKAICFKDVKLGDVVCQNTNEPVVVEKYERLTDRDEDFIALYGKDNGFLHGHPDDIVGLVHQPWREGKTEEDMYDAIREAISIVPDVPYIRDEPDPAREKFAKAVSAIRKAVEVYELGLPAQAGKPLPEEPTRNESLIDRHITP